MNAGRLEKMLDDAGTLSQVDDVVSLYLKYVSLRRDIARCRQEEGDAGISSEFKLKQKEQSQ